MAHESANNISDLDHVHAVIGWVINCRDIASCTYQENDAPHAASWMNRATVSKKRVRCNGAAEPSTQPDGG
jgi:hypothetical protein